VKNFETFFRLEEGLEEALLVHFVEHLTPAGCSLQDTKVCILSSYPTTLVVNDISEMTSLDLELRATVEEKI
jgi:hypothetical protein